jgi:hypothetical protein
MLALDARRRSVVSFHCLDLITKFRCTLVFFAINRFFEFSTQANQLATRLARRRMMFGVFSFVFHITMDIHQQWRELGTEALIVVWTTQSTLITEFKECDATYRAAGLIETTKLLRRLPDLELLHQRSGQ